MHCMHCRGRASCVKGMTCMQQPWPFTTQAMRAHPPWALRAQLISARAVRVYIRTRLGFIA
eukprot:585617-Lingulodinium_polyedra.AAC.1